MGAQRCTRTAAMERAVRSVAASKSARLTSNCTLPPDRSALNATFSVAVKASFCKRRASRMAALSVALRRAAQSAPPPSRPTLRRSRRPQGRIAARGNHSNTPCVRRRMEISKVPPPRSYTRTPPRWRCPAVGNGSGGGFVDKAQEIDARQLGCILGRLALGIVEVRRHRDDSAVQIIA